MSGYEFATGQFDEEEQNEKNRMKRLIILVLVAGLLGIGASASVVYFLSGGNMADIGERLRATARDAVEIRGLPQSYQESHKEPTEESLSFSEFASPRLSKRAVSGSAQDGGENPTAGRFGKILISEIQIAGVSADDEFIEFYNPNDFAVSLNGWAVRRKTANGNEHSLISTDAFKNKSIAAKSYFLAGRSGAELAVNPDAWWAKSNAIAVNNTIILYGKFDEEMVIVDAIGFGDAYEFEGNSAPNPGEGETLARKSADDLDNNSADFILSIATPRNLAAGTGFVAPKAASLFAQSQLPSPAPALSPTSPTSPTAPSLSPNPLSPQTPTPALPSVPSQSPSAPISIVINEILANPLGSDTGREFIELFNVSSSSADLRDWSLQIKEPNSDTHVSLAFFGRNENDITVIPGTGYVLIGLNNYSSLPAADMRRFASLPNSSQTILLLNKDGVVVDTITYDATNETDSSWERLSPETNEFQLQQFPSPTNSTGAGSIQH